MGKSSSFVTRKEILKWLEKHRGALLAIPQHLPAPDFGNGHRARIALAMAGRHQASATSLAMAVRAQRIRQTCRTRSTYHPQLDKMAHQVWPSELHAAFKVRNLARTIGANLSEFPKMLTVKIGGRFVPLIFPPKHVRHGEYVIANSPVEEKALSGVGIPASTTPEQVGQDVGYPVYSMPQDFGYERKR